MTTILTKICLITAITLIASCAPSIKNFNAYQKQFLTKSSFMPSKDNLEGKSPKVVVFSLDENENEVAKQSGLGTSMANDVENILSQNRLAELVDRKAAAKLQKEIALAEMNKTGSYKGPQVADYAVSGSVSNAGFNSKYSSGTTFVEPKSGRIISIPPKYTYSSDVSGILKIYELPSLAVVDVIQFSSKKSRSEDVQQNGGLDFGGIQIGGEKVKGVSSDDSLVRKTGEDAINSIAIDLKNSFAKKGYILEKRVYKNNAIFKISLGSLDGIKQGDKFEVIGQYETENPITQESEVERRIITTGVITDKIDPKTCWVKIDDKNQENAIRLGDSVKMKYKKSFFFKVTRVASSLTN